MKIVFKERHIRSNADILMYLGDIRNADISELAEIPHAALSLNKEVKNYG